jgi:hypothetical protein
MCGWLRRLLAALKQRAQPVWENPESGVSPHSGLVDIPAHVETDTLKVKKPRKAKAKKRSKK